MSEENTTTTNPMLSLPQKAVWVESKKHRLLQDPYGVKHFLKDRRDKKAYYFCSKKKTHHCMVSVTLNLETDMVERISGTHNHDSDVLADAVKKIVAEKMDAVANNPTISPRPVMSDITAKVLNPIIPGLWKQNLYLGGALSASLWKSPLKRPETRGC